MRNGQARSPLCALAGGRSGWYSWKKKTKDGQNLGSVSSFGFEKRVEIVIIRKILLGGKGEIRDCCILLINKYCLITFYLSHLEVATK